MVPDESVNIFKTHPLRRLVATLQLCSWLVLSSVFAGRAHRCFLHSAPFVTSSSLSLSPAIDVCSACTLYIFGILRLPSFVYPQLTVFSICVPLPSSSHGYTINNFDTFLY